MIGEYYILRRFWPDGATGLDGSAYHGKSKLRVLLGDNLLSDVSGKIVADFGCGHGNEVVELARAGAARVIGVDTWEDSLRIAEQKASEAGIAHLCRFAKTLDEPVDLIVSLDSFEHFAEPETLLRTMGSMLRPGGSVIASFGPTWYHPLGGHLFSIFPWAHLLFTERSLMRWRSDFKADGATKFSEVDGGLNRMTIRRFEKIVTESGFRFKHFECVPIRKLAWLNNRLTREFTTAIVRCQLTPTGTVGPVETNVPDCSRSI